MAAVHKLSWIISCRVKLCQMKGDKVMTVISDGKNVCSHNYFYFILL
jgi:hypothetical protein